MATLESLIHLDDDSTLNDLMKNIKPYLKTEATGTSGIFSKMTGDTAPAFLSSNGQLRTRLDHILKSRWGKRVLSPYVLSVYEDNKDEDATVEDFQNAISMDLQYTYAQKWQKLYETCNFTYDPIANVDGKETVTTTHGKKTEYIRSEKVHKDTSTQAPFEESVHMKYDKDHSKQTDTLHPHIDITTETRPDITTESEKQIAGFDSPTYAPSEKQIDTEKAHEVVTKVDIPEKIEEHDVLKDKKEDIQTTKSPEKKNILDHVENGFTDIDKDSGVDTVETVRKGNIGVTTTQHMIEAERKIWEWLLYDVILKDALDFLTIPCYLD